MEDRLNFIGTSVTSEEVVTPVHARAHRRNLRSRTDEIFIPTFYV
jgi:hypothetical protein